MPEHFKKNVFSQHVQPQQITINFSGAPANFRLLIQLYNRLWKTSLNKAFPLHLNQAPVDCCEAIITCSPHCNICCLRHAPTIIPCSTLRLHFFCGFSGQFGFLNKKGLRVFFCFGLVFFGRGGVFVFFFSPQCQHTLSLICWGNLEELPQVVSRDAG